MAFEKITQEELEKVGVTTLPDIPSLQAEEMKRKFEETAKELIVPRINKLIDELMAEAAAAVIGAAVPEGLPEETEKTVQKVIQAVFDELENHKNDAENPHKVTALQTGAYTKQETDQAIGEKVQQIGAGDMAKATYDKEGKNEDVFAYAEKCASDSIAATKIGVSFYNGATDYGTHLYQIGNMIVGVIELYAPKTISAGGWVTYMHVDVAPVYRCNGRSPFGAGGDARDFFIGTDGNLQIYVNTTDAGKTFTVPIAYVKKK